MTEEELEGLRRLAEWTGTPGDRADYLQALLDTGQTTLEEIVSEPSGCQSHAQAVQILLAKRNQPPPKL